MEWAHSVLRLDRHCPPRTAAGHTSDNPPSAASLILGLGGGGVE